MARSRRPASRPTTTCWPNPPTSARPTRRRARPDLNGWADPAGRETEGIHDPAGSGCPPVKTPEFLTCTTGGRPWAWPRPGAGRSYAAREPGTLASGFTTEARQDGIHGNPAPGVPGTAWP